VALVRDVNSLIKDGIWLNEVIPITATPSTP
jgi:hypothetical protein